MFRRNDQKHKELFFVPVIYLCIYYEYYSQSTVIKKENTRNTLVNAECPLGTLEGHVVLYGIYASLSSNSGVLGNGYLIHGINTFPWLIPLLIYVSQWV